jgi:hypothetical protein
MIKPTNQMAFVFFILVALISGVTATMELEKTTVNLPITGNFTVSVYQNNAGQVCHRDVGYYPEMFGYDSIIPNPEYDGSFDNLFCSGGRYNISSPEQIIDQYYRSAKSISPGGWIYEAQKAEKSRRVAQEEYTKSNPEWDLKCVDNDCLMVNTLNKTKIRFKATNISVVSYNRPKKAIGGCYEDNTGYDPNDLVMHITCKETDK